MNTSHDATRSAPGAAETPDRTGPARAETAALSVLARIRAGRPEPSPYERCEMCGAPVADLDPEQRTVATITQEVHVFSGSVLDDLRLVAPEVSREDAVVALRRVGAEDWVSRLPDGLDTIVGETGHALTSAQAQHLAFARLVARVGAARLPFRSRWAVLSASGIYGEIATRAAALGARAWDQRISTSKAEKAALVMEAFWEALWPVRPVPRTGLWTRPSRA